MREWKCCVVLLLAFLFCGFSIANVFQIQFCSTIPTHMTTGDSKRYDSRLLTLHDPPPRKVLKHIYLLGERNSGTTLIEQLLVRQLDSEHINCIPDASSQLEQLFGVCWTLSKNIPVFGSKHIMMHQQRGLNMTEVEFLSQATDILWILVVRDPCSWADAMYRKPWNGGMSTEIRNSSRIQFLQTEWTEIFETNQSKAIQFGHISSSYRNIFALRQHKLRIMIQLMEAVPYRYKIVHFDKIEGQADYLGFDLKHQFGIKTQNITTIKHIRIRHHTPLCLSIDEWKFVHKEIDWDLESKFGFLPSYCHLCHSQESIRH